jgi:glycosyltransferase EpsE
MTAYNREVLIAEAIESFMRSDYPNKKLLICDDCSSDNTFAVASAYSERYSDIHVIRNSVNSGFIFSINRLFSMVESDIVCICDSDDEMTPDRLTHQVKRMKAFNADAIISEHSRIMSDGSLRQNPVRSPFPFFVKPNSKDVFMPSGSLMMGRKVLQRVKGYNEYFSDAFCADIYLINTIASEFSLLYDPTHVYLYRLTPGSMTQQFSLYRLSKLQLVMDLIADRRRTGTDLLELGKFDELEARRVWIEKDRKWRSGQYRTYAARAIDENNFKKALSYMLKSWKNNPFDPRLCRTMYYFIKKRTGIVY